MTDRYALSLQQSHLRCSARGRELPETWCRVRVRGNVSPLQVANAFAKLVARHESLRTELVFNAGSEPVQIVDDARMSSSVALSVDPQHPVAVTIRTSPYISDSVGLRVLVDELLALLVDPEAGLPPLAMQALDVAAFAQDVLASDATLPSRRFWEVRRLGPGVERTPWCAESATAIELRDLSATLDAGTMRWLRADPTGGANRVLAAWAYVTSRAAGPIAIGVRHDGRTYRELDGVVATLGRDLPLRVEPMRGETLPALAHRIAMLRAEAEASHEGFDPNAAWDSAVPEHKRVVPFAFATSRRDVYRRSDVTITIEDEADLVDVHQATLIYVVDDAGEDRLVLRIDGAAVTEADALPLLAQTVELLDRAASSPSSAIDDLAHESAPTLDRRRSAALAAPLVAQIAEQVARTPLGIAVESAGVRRTYRELWARAGSVAAWLRTNAVDVHRPVIIDVRRGHGLLEALLGVWRAGAAAALIDPGDPPRRTLDIIAALRPSAIVTDRLTPAAEAAALPVLRCDADLSSGEADPRWAPRREDIAYVIHTSGSTGIPKGTAVSHGAIATYIEWAAVRYRLQSGDVAIVHSNVAADLALTALLAPLVVAGTVELLAEEPGFAELARRLAEARPIALVKATPSHVDVLHELCAGTDRRAEVRTVVLGGEAVDGLHVRRCRDLFGADEVINEYGPTEATVGCVVFDASNSDRPGRGVPIGTPVPFASVYVLDRALRPTPVWAPGELYIAGQGLALGYVNASASTADRFMPDPFASEPGARMYRTGDRVRRRPDGTLEFLGRIDDQLKIRGNRVEPAEVVGALRTHDAVDNAAVSAITNDGRTSLVAHVVLKQPPAITARTLLAFLAQRLPAYMIPAIRFVGHLPLTQVGKLDRAALDGTVGDERTVGPRTSSEEILAGVFAGVLGLHDVGVDDGFFVLGGDSIRAIQVVAAARQRGLPVTLEQLVRCSTVRALAQEAELGAGRVTPITRPEPFSLLSPNDRERVPADAIDAYPLTALQAGMLFHVEAAPGTAIYHDVASYRIRDRFDAAAFRSAVDRLHARHPVLRTSFAIGWFSQPVQIVHDRVSPSVTVTDLRGVGEDEARELIREWMEGEKRRSFDIAHAPLLRLQVHLRGDDDVQLGVSFHHAILDGWSDATMLTELFLDYAALRRGEASPVTSRACDYATYVALERAAEASPIDAAFWDGALAGATDTRLPAWPASAACSVDDRRSVFSTEVAIPSDVSDGLRSLATSLALPLKSVLLAVHTRVLAGITGTDDVITNMSASGRPEVADGDRVLGLFLNSLPIRLSIVAPSWSALAEAAFDAERRAMPHRRHPYAEIKRRRESDPSEVAFYFTHYHVYDALRGPDALEVREFDVYEETSFGLVANFRLSPFTDRIHLHLTCDPRTIPPAQAAMLAACYERALAQAARQPWHPPTHVGLLPIPAASDSTDAAHASAPLESLLAAIAAHGDRTALAIGARSCTYSELWARAGAIAAAIAKEGPPADRVVAIDLPVGLDLVAAIVGTLVAGCAYVPLETSAPEERVELMLDDVAPTLTLTNRARAEGRVRGIRIDVDDLRDAVPVPPTPVPADALAYVMFTSGSTGRPKGVQVSRRGLATYLVHATSRYPLGRGRVPLLSSVSVDLGITAVLGTLVAGGTLVLAEGMSPAEALLATFAAEAAFAVVKLTPSQARLAATLRKDEPISCEAVIFGGEPLHGHDVEAWRRLAPGAALWNEYGPTEAVVGCAAFAAAEAAAARDVPFGRAFEGYDLYVVDRWLNAVPPGAPGELYIAGPALARGYVNAAGLTAERFVPDPFSTRPGARMYRTGDVVYRDNDENLVFVSRRDDQFKIRGHRVELGEIEVALRSLPGVRDAVARRVATPTGDTIDAFIVSDGPFDEATLLERLVRRLPDVMRPETLRPIDAVPRTASGKIDRSALPAVDATSRSVGYHPPRDPLEEVLAKVWAEALRVPRVGVYDTFASLGGHSIVAVQLVAQIRQMLRVDLPLRDLLESPTIVDLAAAIRRRGGSPFTPIIERIAPDPEHRFEPFPLTDVQHAYWIGRDSSLELGSVGSHLYMEVEGDIDAARLEVAVNSLVARHDMLRAIVHADGQQVVLRDVPPYRILVEDLRAAGVARQNERLEVIRAEMSHHVLPTDRWPGFEVRVFRIEDNIARVCISMDALFADAWSMRLLARDLFRLYRGEHLPPPPELTFRDYVVMATATGSETELARRARAYWWQRIDELPPAPELPLRADAAELWRRPRFVRIGGRIDVRVWTRLKQHAIQHGLTTTCILITAFSEALGVVARRRRFTLNLTLYNRLPVHPDVNEVVGDFTTLDLLEVDVSEGRPFVERARSVQRQLWDDLDHRHISGVEVLRELARRRKRGLRAEMPVVFTSTLNLRELQGDDWIPTDVRTIYSLTQTPQVWLDHQVMEEDGNLLVNWDVVEGLFPEGLIAELLETYLAAVERLCGEVSVWQADLGTWIAARFGERWDRAQATHEAVIPQRIESGASTHATHAPSTVALIAEDRTLTYRDLLREGDRVAAGLQSVGIARGEAVGILVRRGWAQGVAVVGALRAGAAYVPIDPDSPELRRTDLLQRAGIRVAVVDGADAVSLPAFVRGVSTDTDTRIVVSAPAALDDLAYVIYTSGSTGQPKGVRIRHDAAWNTIAVVNRRWGIGPSDAVLAVSSLTFDLSVYDLFGMWAAGGRVVVPSARRWRDPAHWAELVSQHRITVWNSVPALMELLVEYAETRRDGSLSSLRLVLLSGDWIPVGLPDRIRRVVGGPVQVVSLGGATEGSIWSIAHEIKPEDAARTSIPYGHALANQRIFVWDEALRERATWATGELYIAGAGVADGYHADPERTAASFLRHSRSEMKVYRTGDLGRHLPDGTIEFLGREDDQVKVAGHRIELGEVEAALRRCPGVADAVAVARGGRGAADRRLVAFATPVAGHALVGETLRDHLRSLLPAYMIPASVQVMSGFPLTANGKVDRAALATAAPAIASSAAPTAQRTPLEARIARTWSEVLALPDVDLHDDFFELGGNSLRAIQLLTRIRSEWRIRLPLERLLEHPTVARLASAVEAELVDRLETMSEAEAAELLASLSGGAP